MTRKPPARVPQPMMMNDMFTLDISSQVGSCMPLSMMRIGTLIHNVEMRPGQGAKLVRAAGTVAKILTEPNTTSSRYSYFYLLVLDLFLSCAMNNSV